MEQHIKTIDGEVTDVFAHRFVVATEDGKVLADLGRKGAERVTLEVGDEVEVAGEAKPSELKVFKITRKGFEPVDIGHRPEKDKHEGDADPAVALRAVEANGFTVVGEPRRRPEHFEVMGRDGAGDMVEFHVEFDGTVRMAKPSKAA